VTRCRVQKLGGRVRYDYEVERDGDLILGKPRLPAPKWLIALLGIDYFDEVVSVG